MTENIGVYTGGYAGAGSKNVFNSAHPLRWLSEMDRLEEKERELKKIKKYMPQIREALHEKAENDAQKRHVHRMLVEWSGVDR